MYPKFIEKLSISSLKGSDSKKTKEVLEDISKKLTYHFVPKNRVLFRAGDIGNKYYIILKGRIGIVIFKEYSANLSFLEYAHHLLNLKQMGEDNLLQRTLIANSNRFGINYKTIQEASDTAAVEHILRRFSREALPAEQESLVRKFVVRLETISRRIELEKTNVGDIFAYMKALEPVPTNVLEERAVMTIMKPELVHQQVRGESFGEGALDGNNNRRGATIFISEDCDLGILDKDNYDLCMKEINDKIRKDNQAVLFDNELFKTIYSKTNLTRRFYDWFVLDNYFKKRRIVSRGSSDNTLFIVKSGEFMVSVDCSLKEICRIIKQMGGKVADLVSRDEYINNDKMKRFVDAKRSNKIKIVGKKEVLGLGDIKHEGNWLFDVELLSTKGEVFSLKQKVVS